MTPGVQIGAPIPTALVEPWPSDWVGQLLDLHHNATHGFLPGGQLGKLLKPVKTKIAFAVLLAAWGRFVASPEAKYGPSYFLRQMGDYAEGRASKAVFRGVLSEEDVRVLSR